MRPWTQYFTLPEGVGRQKTEVRDVVFRDCGATGKKSVKLDPSFISIEGLEFVNCTVE